MDISCNKRLATLIALFMALSQMSAQDLFSSTTQSEIEFTPEQLTKLSNMTVNPIYSDYFFVSVNDFAAIQQNGMILVNLPDKDSSELFVGKEIQFTSSDEFIYYGELNPCDDTERMGYIHLIAENGNIFGQINLEDEIYDLQDFGGGKNVLFKIDQNIYTEAECATESTSSTSSQTENRERAIASSRSGGGCNVRVLFLYTQAAEAVGNPFNSARLYMTQTRQTACNSDVDVNFSLAGVEELPNFMEAGTARDTRGFLRTDPEVNQLRDDLGADLVVLLTDGNWTSTFGQTFGIAYLDEWGDPDFGYAVVELDAGGGSFTCTHEIAHDFGCKHDNDNRGAPDFAFDARAHNFFVGTWPFRHKKLTVMHVLPGPSVIGQQRGERILNVSNPEVEIDDTETGVTDERENADQLGALGCTIADYRPFVEPMTVSISGPNKANNNDTYTWCANVDFCHGTVTTVDWEYSYDGVNYFPFAAGTCFDSQMPLHENLYLRVTVTCSDGQQAVDWHVTLNNNGDFPCDDLFSRIEQNSEATVFVTNGSAEISLYPNPSSNNLNIELYLTEDRQVEITLIELMGSTTKELCSKVYSSGLHKEKYNISDLKSGYYFVKTKVGEETITKSIIKQ